MNEIWTRLEEQLRIHTPGIAARLRPGVGEAQLAAFETEIGRRFPDDLRLSYLRHDGCEYVDKPPEVSVAGLLGHQEWMPLKRSLEEWREWQAMFNDDDPYFFGDDVDRSSWSKSRIRPWQTPPPSWLPLGQYVGLAERIFVDMLPGPVGRVGQIILVNPAARRGIEAASWGAYLAALTEGLEQGLVEMTTGDSVPYPRWTVIATGQPFQAPGFVLNCP